MYSMCIKRCFSSQLEKQTRKEEYFSHYYILYLHQDHTGRLALPFSALLYPFLSLCVSKTQGRVTFKRRRGGWRVCVSVCLKGGQGVCLPSRFRDPVGEQWQELIRWQSPGLVCVCVCVWMYTCASSGISFLSFRLAGRWPQSRVRSQTQALMQLRPL